MIDWQTSQNKVGATHSDTGCPRRLVHFYIVNITKKTGQDFFDIQYMTTSVDPRKITDQEDRDQIDRRSKYIHCKNRNKKVSNKFFDK